MYTVNYNGVTFTNSSSQTVNVHGLGKIDIRNSSDNLTGRDGGNVWATKYGMRDITIFGMLYADDLDSYLSLRSALQLAFDTSVGEQLLTITLGSKTRTILATVIEFSELDESEGEFAEAPYRVVLRCGSPFFGDETAYTTDYISPGIVGGTPVPMPVPSPIGGIGESLTITNSGDVAIYPIFEILGSITNARVQNNSTGKYFEINTTINSGQTLIAERTNQGELVTVSGVSYYQYFEGEVFELAQGTNNISFNGSSYINAQLRLTYRFLYKTF